MDNQKLVDLLEKVPEEHLQLLDIINSHITDNSLDVKAIRAMPDAQIQAAGRQAEAYTQQTGRLFQRLGKMAGKIDAGNAGNP